MVLLLDQVFNEGARLSQRLVAIGDHERLAQRMLCRQRRRRQVNGGQDISIRGLNQERPRTRLLKPWSRRALFVDLDPSHPGSKA